MQDQDIWDFSSPPPPPPQKRSTFVTVVAWIFIVLGGIAVFSGIIEVILMSTVLPPDKMSALMTRSIDMERIPAFYRFMYAHLLGFMLVGLAISLFLLVSSIGLLKRRNWARIAFIAFMVFGIASEGVSLFWLPSLYSAMHPMQEMPKVQGLPVESITHVIQKVMTISSVVVALAFIVLFVWIIKRLVSEKVRREFGA